MPIVDPMDEVKKKEIKEFSDQLRDQKKEMVMKQRALSKNKKKLTPEERALLEESGEIPKKTDPRQELFLKLYQSPASPTFANATQSALKAGYSPWYANGILTHGKNWIHSKKNQQRRLRMLEKSEANLEGFLSDKAKTVEEKKLKFNATVFALKTLGQDVYSEKSLHESAGEVRHVIDASQAERILRRRLSAEVDPVDIETKKAEIIDEIPPALV